MSSNYSRLERCHLDVGDGLRLHAAMSGSGPPLVLLHGFTGSAETWAELRPALEVAYRVVAVDLPGHGRSSAPEDPERYSLDRFAVDLANALDQLGLERVAMLGYSLGGRAALQFAQRYGDLTALVLVSTSSGIRDDVARCERVASDVALAESIERDGIEAFVERWERLPLWASQQVLPRGWRRKLRKQRMNNDPVGLANSLRGAGAGAGSAVPVVLREIVAPSLILAGALDQRYVEHGRSLESELPNSRMEVIPGAGHAIHLEQPEFLVTATTTFLGAVS